ncbi:MAG: hypothetical protein AAF696_05410 [Bacteroidota bacterium]
MKIKQIFSLCICLIPCWLLAQKVELSLLVEQFGGKNIIYGKSVGFAGTTPPEFQAFEQFVGKATEAELVSYLDHKDVTVKAYAFWGLAHKYPVRARSEFALLKGNKSEFGLMLGGCIMSATTLGEFCQQRLDGPMSYLFSHTRTSTEPKTSTY